MSKKEKNKEKPSFLTRKEKAKIITGIIGSAVLVGGTIAGVSIITESETKIEAKDEENNNPKKPTKPKINKPTSNFNINYEYLKSDWTHWNGILNFNDEKKYLIIKYGNYASNWNDFINGAGYSKLYLKGLDAWVDSPKTFGRKDLNSYALTPFNNDYVFDLTKISESNDENNPYLIKLYDANDYIFSTYKIDCKAYLEFFIDENSKELKVKCWTRNYLLSQGAVGRGLEVNFKLDAFYFIP